MAFRKETVTVLVDFIFVKTLIWKKQQQQQQQKTRERLAICLGEVWYCLQKVIFFEVFKLFLTKDRSFTCLSGLPCGHSLVVTQLECFILQTADVSQDHIAIWMDYCSFLMPYRRNRETNNKRMTIFFAQQYWSNTAMVM